MIPAKPRQARRRVQQSPVECNPAEQELASEQQCQILKPVEITTVPGLLYIENFLTREEETELLQHINGPLDVNWINEKGRFGGTLHRRNQQYGWKYNYETRAAEKTSSMPEFFDRLIDNIMTKTSIVTERPDQVIINEYLPGQGITPHVDNVEHFGDIVIGVSLLAPTMMKFVELQNHENFTDVYIMPRSLYFITGTARYKFKHSISTDKYDIVNGKQKPRKKRISLTFRTVIKK